MNNQQNFFKVIYYNIKEESKVITKSGENLENEFFPPNLIPQIANNQMDVTNCINIIGPLNPNIFMNNLFEYLPKKFPNNLFLEASRDNLEFVANFEETNVTNVIQISIFSCNNGYILRFVNNGGDENFFLEKRNLIANIVEDMLNY